MIEHQKMWDCLKMYQQKKLEDQGIADAEQQVELLEKDEVVTTAISEISQIDAQALPVVISQQFSKITELEKKVDKAKKSANLAKDKAKDAENKSAKFGHKKAAIEALQTATVEIAKSEGDILDAMNVSFEYQQQLGQITQYLFMLGVSNIAATRTVIQQLRLELQKTPKEKISDLAKNEILAVIRQLEAQEDMSAKQEKQDEALKKHKKLLAESVEKDKIQDAQIFANAQDIDKLEQQDAEQDKLIAEGIEKDRFQDVQISENAQDIDELERQGAEQGRRLDEGDKKDEEQDAQISANAQDIDELERQGAEQGRRLDEGDKKDEEQDAQISENMKDIDKLEQQDAEQDKLIAEGIEKDAEQDEIISKMAKDDETQDLLIEENRNKNEEQDIALADLALANNQQDELIKSLVEKCENQSKKIEEIEEKIAGLEVYENKSKKWGIVTACGTILAIVLAIIKFFI